MPGKNPKGIKDHRGVCPDFEETPEIFVDFDSQLVFVWGEHRYGLKDLIKYAVAIQGQEVDLTPTNAVGIYKYDLSAIEVTWVWHRLTEVAFCPKEDLPLYINCDFDMVKEIAIERLKYLSE